MTTSLCVQVRRSACMTEAKLLRTCTVRRSAGLWHSTFARACTHTRTHAHTHTHTCAHKYTHVQDCYLVAGTTQQMQPSNVSTTLSTLLPLLASSTIPSVSSMNSMIGARRESSKEQQLQPQ